MEPYLSQEENAEFIKLTKPKQEEVRQAALQRHLEGEAQTQLSMDQAQAVAPLLQQLNKNRQLMTPFVSPNQPPPGGTPGQNLKNNAFHYLKTQFGLAPSTSKVLNMQRMHEVQQAQLARGQAGLRDQVARTTAGAYLTAQQLAMLEGLSGKELQNAVSNIQQNYRSDTGDYWQKNVLTGEQNILKNLTENERRAGDPVFDRSIRDMRAGDQTAQDQAAAKVEESNIFSINQEQVAANAFTRYSLEANKARDALGQLYIMKDLLAPDGIKTDVLTPLTMRLQSYAQALGMDIKEGDLSHKQLFGALANRLTLQARGSDLPGSMSEKDVQFLQAMVPQLAQTTEGNRLIIEMLIMVDQRKLDIQNELRTVQTSGEMYAVFDRYQNINMFEDIEKRATAQLQQNTGGKVRLAPYPDSSSSKGAKR